MVPLFPFTTGRRTVETVTALFPLDTSVEMKKKLEKMTEVIVRRKKVTKTQNLLGIVTHLLCSHCFRHCLL